ncbi:hypothetical protein [Flavobacterium sp. CF136]|uniref:hypothetical protein n=1 Tax=Flavobacterium sp. (strain CF136) TaxID=1144313 RepID=UPI0002719735|nr:hypothetical protein [Flavobacterium sp. CF136]EJL59015.1 hypothetical protein PMI10_04415 [Flavobacterium sp. CF136]
MKQLNKLFVIISLFTLSCANAQYLESYEPINVFLETQKIDKSKKHILQANKASNKQALRIFNGDVGPDHIIDPKNPIDYTDGLFVEKHWKKMYEEYIHDTIKRYWKKEDFPEYKFILEDGNGLFKHDFLVRYIGTGLHEAIIISEPMYYMDKKYIIFYYAKVYSTGGGNYSTVIMKKENEKWIVVRVMGDYIFY